jgi:TonB-linked SusC/RagA family outer membrane protein
MWKKSLLFICCLVAYLASFAQNRTISGIVTSASDGVPLPGVTIVIQGTTTGTITDMDGNYSIEVSPDDNLLLFSFIGMKTQEIEIGDQNTIDVKLESDALGLEEIVVTALGIRKEKKSLGYAIENVPAMELVEGNQTNVVNALQGKVAGVTVTNSGGAPGASSVIMIRGGNSLSENNQPLFVVDGIPIDNTTESGSLVASSNRGLDINSEDIESVSILKGPAAAAMYGIKAANGAVIITTKSGKAGEAKISYNGTFSVDNVIGVPEVQTIYGLGNMTNQGISTTTTYSWDTTRLADTVPTFKNIEDFYNTAYTNNHNLSYSGGNEKSTIYASVGRLAQDGVIDKTRYERTSFKVKANSSLKKNLEVGSSFNYINSQSNRTRQGSSTSGNFRNLLSYPANVDMTDYLDSLGNQIIIPGLGDETRDNPYWSADNNPITNKVDRFIAIANVSYNPLKFLNITYRVGSDIFFEKNRSVYAYSSAKYRDGYLSEYEIYNRITTSTLMLNLNHKINQNSFGATFGNNVEDNYRRRINWSGEEFIEPDFIGINNIASENRLVSQSSRRKRIVSFFGELKYDYNSLLFVNATGRLDMSSTLPKTNNKFFYPSVGLSIITSKLLEDMGIYTLNGLGIDYWKIRTTWAQVGKDAPPHVLQTPMSSATNTYTADPQGFIRATYPAGNPVLVPEFTNSFEIGTDIRMFQNRISIDFSYYSSISSEQILNIRMPPSTSTWSTYLNDGSIHNTGIELLLGVQAISKPDFRWDVDLNFTKSTNEVRNLPGEIKQVEESDSWAFNSIAEGASILNSSVFGIYGAAFMRDDDGNLLLDEDGMVQEASAFENLGDRFPNWTAGLTNNFNYKNITLNFLIDVSYGNDVLNGTKAAMVFYGLDPLTLNRNETYVFEGLRSTGTTDDEGNLIYVPNDLPVVLDQEYYQDVYCEIGENFVEDGSWVRLRYISLSYDLPSKWFGDRIDKAQFSVTGRNLIIITDYSGVDPEINTIGAAVKGTGSIGIDNLGTPSTKGFDFSLKLTF